MNKRLWKLKLGEKENSHRYERKGNAIAMHKLYLKNIDVRFGEFYDLKMLKSNNLVFSEECNLENFGYVGCYVSNKDKECYEKSIQDNFIEEYEIENIDYILYNSTFIEYKNFNLNEKRFMEYFLDYPLNRCLDKINKSIPHIGITQQACNGLFSCIEHANRLLRNNEKLNNILCISDDILPKNCYYDRPEQRMLFSDNISGVTISREKSCYELVDIKNIHIANDNYFLFIHSVNCLIDDLCKANLIQRSQIRNFFVPNFWGDAWLSIIKAGSNDEICFYNNMKKYAHGLSADFLVNIGEYKDLNRFEQDGYYIGISYGYGGNISCLLFKYCS